jgi:hypothetical protein
MMLIRLTPCGEGSDVQTFECERCGETKVVETKELPKKHADPADRAT